MLVDHFAHVLHADIGPINNAKTWEVSRAFSIEYGQRHHNLQRKAACILTTFEVALAPAAARCVGFSDFRVLPFFQTLTQALELVRKCVVVGKGWAGRVDWGGGRSI